jgi:hypothetical protein
MKTNKIQSRKMLFFWKQNNLLNFMCNKNFAKKIKLQKKNKQKTKKPEITSRVYKIM